MYMLIDAEDENHYGWELYEVFCEEKYLFQYAEELYHCLNKNKENYNKNLIVNNIAQAKEIFLENKTLIVKEV